MSTVFRKFKRNHVSVFVSIVLLATGALGGILFQKYYSVGELLQDLGVWERGPLPSIQRDEVLISSVRSKRVMVALVFGQSNSANFGESPRTAGAGVYNFYKGKLYAAQDPLLGANGNGGSVWTRLGDKLITSKQYDAVVFVPLGSGGSMIARWTPGGDLHPRLIESLRDLKNHGLSTSHILWHQGEADALFKTSAIAYKLMFLEMLSSIREQGVGAPFYVSVATRCGKERGYQEIRQVQQDLVNPAQGLHAGPDSDVLGLGDRYDGCHLTNEGLEKFANLWLERLKPK